MSDYFAPMAPDASGAMRLTGGDERLWVRFEKRSRRNAYKSELEGRPIYEPVDYIKIQQPGERDQVMRPVQEADKQRFGRQWEQYQRETEQTPEGTPIQLLFPNEPHVVELMLDLRIQTMEQLAQLTEGAIERLGMDGRKYVSKAQAALDRAQALKEVTRLEHTLRDAQDELETLRKANADLQRRMDALEELAEERPAKRKKGLNLMADDAAPRPEPPRPPRPEIIG